MIPENAPLWLKNADTENADVEISERWPYVIWRGGVWSGGEWHSGEWHSGEWRGGVWHDGEWLSGVWRDGVWLSGVWHSGEWLGGERTCQSKHIPLIDGDEIIIGCVKKTVEEWDKWFAGEGVYETKRDDPEFLKIFAHYRAVREYKRIMDAGEVVE